jgi:hypothetical protein
MGCDIHLYVEAKHNGKWVNVDEYEIVHPDTTYSYKKIKYPYYDGRNYDLFAILANVRNGHGFAGIKTGEGFNPISEPKGLPVDVSPEVLHEADGWEGDGHSHSWHTVADLFAYDWTQVTTQQGYVDATTYYRWNRFEPEYGEGPDTYSSMISGGLIKKISEEEMKSLIEDISDSISNHWDIEVRVANELTNVYCMVSWETPYYAIAPYFWSHTIPRLLRLGKPEDVRIVFWFDN